MTIKEFLIKRRLIHILFSRSKRNYVTVYLDGEDMIIKKTGRFRDEYFGVRVPVGDMIILESYVRDGSFLIYRGRVQSSMLQFILDNRRKWRKLVRWTKRG